MNLAVRHRLGFLFGPSLGLSARGTGYKWYEVKIDFFVFQARADKWTLPRHCLIYYVLGERLKLTNYLGSGIVLVCQLEARADKWTLPRHCLIYYVLGERLKLTNYLGSGIVLVCQLEARADKWTLPRHCLIPTLTTLIMYQGW